MPDYPAEQKSRFEMWWCFGWPYDTSVAMARLVFCGLFDRYPNLRIITHHLGGKIPFYDGRVGPGLDVLGARTSDEDYSKILPSLKRPHLDYFRDFYADTAMFGGGAHALRCGYEFSARTGSCSRPIHRSARSSRQSRRCKSSICRTPSAARSSMAMPRDCCARPRLRALTSH
jgi:hypothetical protein